MINSGNLWENYDEYLDSTIRPLCVSTSLHRKHRRVFLV
jgi:hypothetical protein